jgi:2-methylisocitrate lyase-like PEP mutase family enzyme
METRKAFRAMIENRKPVLTPGAWDPLNALLVESLGFKACYMGGWITGAHMATTEPMTTMTEMVDCASRVTKLIKIPLIVDADAGFGDALHTMRCVREFEFAGVAAIHIEDQLYPKRAHYHKGVKHVMPLDEFMEKIRAALRARTDPDFVIIARTDSRNMVDGSLKETIERCQAFVEAGVDMISPHITDIDEYRTFRKEVPDIPVMEWISRKYAEELDIQLVLDPLVAITAAYEATKAHYQKFMETGDSKITPHVHELMEKIQELIHFSEYYRIEEETTEARWQKESGK